VDITTVADDLIVLHDGTLVHRFEDLSPDTEYDIFGRMITTMSRPPGELLCRIATVNDVHFGETEAGKIDDNLDGPIQRVADGEAPYPETMNSSAAAEIAAIEPTAVIVKGDLSRDGQPDELAAFEAIYRGAFGERLFVVRGNHDAYQLQTHYAGDQWIEVPGLAVALLDTTIPGKTTGTLRAEQIAWLDERSAAADRPVLVMGHHQQWIARPPGVAAEAGPDADDSRGDGYFGLHPDASDALAEVVARRNSIIGYTAGHTHRHRVRTMATLDGGATVPSIEVGCVKDFPGTWAEYRIYEGGVTQIVHRISTPEALDWSERCRHLYSDFGIDYESYALGRLEDRCLTLPLR
jgi:3',5'-cyclic-AMP phosphodiesterase